MNERMIITAPSVIDLDLSIKVGNCFYVDKKQPSSVYKAIEQLAYYFKREGQFDFVQYSAYEDKNNKNSEVYVWVDEGWEDLFLTGAINFRFKGDIGQSKNWEAEWVWIHPYYRNQGLLSGAWKEFEKKYGKGFRCEPPISKSMEAFLNKVNKGSANELEGNKVDN